MTLFFIFDDLIVDPTVCVGTLEKVDISQDLLDIRLPSRDVSTAASDSMRERGLQARIDKYTKATTSANVREELGSVEEKMMKVVQFLLVLTL